ERAAGRAGAGAVGADGRGGAGRVGGAGSGAGGRAAGRAGAVRAARAGTPDRGRGALGAPGGGGGGESCDGGIPDGRPARVNGGRRWITRDGMCRVGGAGVSLCGGVAEVAEVTGAELGVVQDLAGDDQRRGAGGIDAGGEQQEVPVVVAELGGAEAA